MGLIDKIKAEVEKKTYMEQGFRDEDSEYGYRSCARDILSFLDTLKVEELWKPADGDDLPEIDRVVIALIPAYDGWKVVFAHRPDPVGYWGKSILSDEYEHFQPETYDGWNIPNIKWWLNLDLPNMED